jgi:hypothetical protein
MRLSPELEKYRVRDGSFSSAPFADYGAFQIPGPHGRTLRVIASSGDPSLGIDWEHVSVSLPTRCPNWPEMCFIKSLFWDDEEAVMQLHPPRSKWINNHAYCLHLWKPPYEIQLPPSVTVGDQAAGVLHE